MGLFKFAWEIVKTLAGIIGKVIGGIALQIIVLWGICAVGGGFVLLGSLAKEHPLLGVPLLSIVVLFCLWCAFFQQSESTPPQTVLRGPFVVKSDEQPLHIRIQRGSGKPQAESEDFRGSAALHREREQP